MTKTKEMKVLARETCVILGILDSKIEMFIAKQYPLGMAAIEKDSRTGMIVWQTFLTACKRRERYTALGALKRLHQLCK
jgi:hypothetical protein